MAEAEPRPRRGELRVECVEPRAQDGIGRAGGAAQQHGVVGARGRSRQRLDRRKRVLQPGTVDPIELGDQRVELAQRIVEAGEPAAREIVDRIAGLGRDARGRALARPRLRPRIEPGAHAGREVARPVPGRRGDRRGHGLRARRVPAIADREPQRTTPARNHARRARWRGCRTRRRRDVQDRDDHGHAGGHRRERPDDPAAPAMVALQLVEQRVHRREARGRIERQPAREQAPQPARRAGRHRPHPARQHVLGERAQRLAVERSRAEHGLVERHAERELVRACVGRLAAHLLRRHVRRRPDQRACHGRREGDMPGGGEVRALVDRERPGQAEVGHPRASVAADQHVVGLEVAMHEPDRVRRREAAAGLQEHLEPRGARAGRLEPARQGHALDELHREEQLVADATDVEHGDDVRVRQLRHRLGLARHPGALRLEVAGSIRMQQLDRDPAVELGIVGDEHDAHAALADARAELVAAERDRRRAGRTRRTGDGRGERER
jgi:hypothetical protein